MSEATVEKDQGDDPVDLEAIVPSEAEITIDGIRCRVRRLKTREFLALIRVMTSGLGPAMSEVNLSTDDVEALADDLAALMLLALPNAVEEFTIFLRLVVDPVEKKDRGRVSTYLADNPDVEVLLDIFETVAVQEKDDLAVLAGKFRATWVRLTSLYRKK